MSSVDVGTAFVKVVPDTTGFRALLQSQVNAAVAQVKVPPLVATVNTAGATVGGNAAASAAAASTNLREVGRSSEIAAKGMVSARNESRILQGSLVGLSRVTPVAVFGLGVVGTAAIAAGLAIKSSINNAADLEAQLNLFQAVTGSTADQMRDVSNVATQLGADLSLPATSANDAAVALTELAKAGLSVEDAINASRGVLQLAAAGNISAGEAARLAATELNAFGLAGTEAARVTDLLAGASIAAQGEIGDFANAFQQAAAAAATADISVETTTALLTQLARAGIRGSDAGTALRTTILRLVPTTKEAAEFQKALGIELDRNATIGEQLPSLIEQYRTALLRLPPADRIEALNQIFGQDAFRAASIFFNRAPGDLARVTTEVSKAGSGAALAEARMKGFGGAIEGLKSSAQTLGTSLGSAVLPPLEEIVRTLAELTTGATTAVTALKPVGSAVSSSFDAVTGGAQGTILLAGVGLIAKRFLDARKTAKLVAEANVAAAGKTLVAWEVAEAKLTAATIAAAEKQIIAANSVAAANERAAGLSAAAWKVASATTIATAGGAARNILSTNKGLIAGLLATIAGSELSDRGGTTGDVGGVLGSAGQGALFGSFFGPVGTAVGGGVGAISGALNSAKEETQRNKDSWDALKYEEQIQALRSLGGKAGSFLSTFGLKLKPNPFSGVAAEIFGSITAPDILSQAPQFDIAAPVGFNTRNDFADRFAKFLKKGNISLPKATQEAALTRRNQLSLNLALARMSGSTQQTEAALRAQAESDRRLIATLQKNLVSPNKDLSDFKFNVKERAAIAEQLKQAIGDLISVEKELQEIASEPFTLPVGLTIETIRAGSTRGLQDNLAADRAVVDAYRKELASTKATGSELDALRVDLANAEARVAGDTQAIEDEAKANREKALAEQEQAASDAANAREANLRFFAEQAGNQGVAEKRLIDFLRKRVSDAKGNVAEFSAAQSELRAERLKFSQAVVAVAKADIDLRNARLATRLQAAGLTPQIADNLKVYNLQLKLFTQDKENAERLAAAAKGNKAKQQALLLEVESLKQKILGVRASIKSLQGEQGGGFSLQQLFQTAVDQFNEFSGNISTRGGQFTGGDARGQLATGLVNNPVVSAVTQMGRENLTEAQKQTLLLQQIRDGVAVDRSIRPLPEKLVNTGITTARHITNIVRSGS